VGANKLNIYKSLILSFAILAISDLHAQLLTQGNQSPTQLVQDVLLGGGVTVSNIQYQGAAASIGYFNGANCNIGLNEGLIFTTGTIFNTGNITDRYGPHGPNDRANAGFDNNQPGYTLLNNVVGTSTFNATVLSFDFVPYANVVEFRYVFGSEEYPEYVGSQFNDVFGFFITGPGIGANVNIASIPGTNVPVTINNVNAQTNAQYFVDNGDGNLPPQNMSNTYVQYDGFTQVLTARADVICGEQYRIILAIADVGDGIYDSGIFLEANSFSSPVAIDIDYELSSQAFGNDFTMAEGCTSATVTLTRAANNANAALTIPITISGTATEGLDYSNIPNSVTFNPNQLEVQFTLDALIDVNTEGLESIYIDFGIPDPCGQNDYVRVELAINDVAPVQVLVPEVMVTCPGQEVTLTANATGGGSGYNYLWSNGSSSQSIVVSPTTTTSYNVTVTDNCLGQSANAVGVVVVPEYDPMAVQAQSDFISDCPFIPHTFTAEASGGAGGYTFEWSNSAGAVMGSGFSLEVSPSVSGIYFVTATDLCGNEAFDGVSYTIVSPPLYPFVRIDTTICIGDSAFLQASGTGGFGQISFFWPHSGETSPNIWVTPNQTTIYTVEVSDECQTFITLANATVTTISVNANFEFESPNFFQNYPILFENTSVNADNYHWVFSNGYQSFNTHVSYAFQDTGQYSITLYAQNLLGCRDSITKNINIRPEYYIYVPNTFTPDEFNRTNEYFTAYTYNISELKVAIFNRWGEAIYTSNALDFKWFGDYKGAPVQDGTYIYRIEYTTIEGDKGKLLGHVNLLR
jgi:gliding motility-associated-like protein